MSALRRPSPRAGLTLLFVVLGIAWGEPNQASGKAGTFHELWRLQWQVEFAVSIIEAGVSTGLAPSSAVFMAAA